MNAKKKDSAKRGPEIVAVDLFCGAGGLTRGLLDAGVDVRLGVDFDANCKFAYETNNGMAKFLNESVTNLQGKTLKKIFEKGQYSLLAGCAPCQTFSRYNQKATNADDRWWLLSEFGRLVEETHPDFVTMENVQDLADKDVFKEFVSGLEKAHYHVSSQVVNCPDYGIPQRRQRLVLLASRHGKVNLIPSDGEKPKTVRQVIGKQPKLSSGGIDPKDPLHRCARLSPLNLRRIQASKPGGSWRDWPEELRAKCHTRETGKTYGGVYGRMSWDALAPTMTTQFFGFGNGRFGHPDQDRAISLREGALFQTFPQDYDFIDPGKRFSIGVVGRMIGNAVPVKLGEVVGKSFIRHVEELRAREQARQTNGRSRRRQ